MITVGVAGKYNQLTVPGSLLKRLLEEIRSTALQYDLRVEVGACAESPVFMGWPGIAVGAGMETATIGIHAPSKRKVRTVVPTEYLVGVVLKELNLYPR